MSEVSICNQALGWLGANLITSFEDGTTESKLCRENYAPLRDSVLEAADWSFARRRAVLSSPEVDTPAFGYAFSHVVPNQAIRIINADNTPDGLDNLDYEFEDRRILCDEKVVYIKYLEIVESTARFSPLFTQALAQRIAADLAVPIAESAALHQFHWQLYMSKINEAATIDGLQGRAQKRQSRGLKRVR